MFNQSTIVQRILTYEPYSFSLVFSGYNCVLLLPLYGIAVSRRLPQRRLRLSLRGVRLGFCNGENKT
jgi:hypothetical protein